MKLGCNPKGEIQVCSLLEERTPANSVVSWYLLGSLLCTRHPCCLDSFTKEQLSVEAEFWVPRPPSTLPAWDTLNWRVGMGTMKALKRREDRNSGEVRGNKNVLLCARCSIYNTFYYGNRQTYTKAEKLVQGTSCAHSACTVNITYDLYNNSEKWIYSFPCWAGLGTLFTCLRLPS
jgi:hypothetical protein